MQNLDPTLEARIHSLEVSRRRAWALTCALLVSIVGLAASGVQDSDFVERLVVRELVVVDERETPRVRIGSDNDADRRDHAAGIVLFDKTGTERGGLVTFDDGSVVFALDAPAGVGAPMRDRAAMVVAPDGSAAIKLIDNRTAIPVRLVSDPAGGGGLEFLDYDLENRKYTVIRQSASGQEETERDLGD